MWESLCQILVSFIIIVSSVTLQQRVASPLLTSVTHFSTLYKRILTYLFLQRTLRECDSPLSFNTFFVFCCLWISFSLKCLPSTFQNSRTYKKGPIFLNVCFILVKSSQITDIQLFHWPHCFAISYHGNQISEFIYLFHQLRKRLFEK